MRHRADTYSRSKTSNLTGRLRRLVGLVCIILMLGGCVERSGGLRAPGAVCHTGRFDVYPDSIILHSGVVVRAAGDTALQIRVMGTTLRSIPVVAERMWIPRLESRVKVLDMLVRLESSAPMADSYGPLTPLELYLLPAENPAGMELLISRLKNGYVVPSETRRLSWPAINDNSLWLLAASELAKIATDPRLLEEVTARASAITQLDRAVSYNSGYGLVTGIPRYMTSTVSDFPDWMQSEGMCGSVSLTTNVAYYGALSALASIATDMARRNDRLLLPTMGLDADTLRSAILQRLWDPEEGYFNGMLYGPAPALIPLPSSDNIGQALAVLSGVANPAMANSILRNTPVGEDEGCTLFTPLLTPQISRSDNTALHRAVRALWAVATSRGDSPAIYNNATGVLIHDAAASMLATPAPVAGGSAEFNRPLTALLMRGILGISYHTDGIALAPSVPPGLGDTLTVHSLRWRKGWLNVRLCGTGNRITSCTLDGEESDPVFPSSMQGEHTMEITLTHGEGVRNIQAHPKFPATILPAPEVAWITPDKANIALTPGEDAKADPLFVPYVNGVEMAENGTSTLTLPPADGAQWVQIALRTPRGALSLASEPHLFLPPGSSMEIPLCEAAKGGTKLIDDSRLAESFVESNRWKNRIITLTAEVDRDGEYLIDVHYINGLGVVNVKRRTALRSLRVNGRHEGIFVFPQLSSSAVSIPADPRNNGSWQSLTDFSNPLRVTLRKGVNTLELRYYQPSPVFVDPASNVVLADYLRLIRL